MSYVRIWVHVVFSVYNRDPLLDASARSQLYAHIKENCRSKEIFLDSIGGWSDHLHVLISLGREQNIAKVVMLIKGESAHWINQQGWLRGKFRWQDDYYAISVSESQVAEVRAYIARQEIHHKAVLFEREVATLDGMFGLKPEH
ncbi:MAG: IS200/IS605 family transposase [Acidobacteriota bacterium]